MAVASEVARDGGMKPRRILILVENLPVPFDRRVWMEATTLRDAGYGVSVICPLGNYTCRREVLEGVSIYRYALRSRSGLIGHVYEYTVAVLATFVLCWRVLFREGFDVIQSANPPDLFFLIGAFFKLLGKKFVFDHHDLVPESCEMRWKGVRLMVARSLCLAAEWATFRTADWVISTNESYKRIAISRGGVAPERVTIVRSAPRLTLFRPVSPEPARRHGRSHLVCYLGMMGPNDGVDYLLRAIRHLVHDLRRHDIHFVLLGSGDIVAELKEQTSNLGISEFVQFAGLVADDAELKTWVSSADVCVVPDPMDALNNLSTMNKVVEYMALAKPMVAFDLMEHRVSAGDAALYARPNDERDFASKIAALLDDPDRRRAMGEYARRRFENQLAWEHQSQALLSAYHALLQPLGRQRMTTGAAACKARLEVTLMGVRYDNVTRAETLDWMERAIRERGCHQIVTPNADHILIVRHDTEYRDIVKHASLVVPDGMGVIYASWLLATPLKMNVGGRLLLPEFSALSAQKGYRLFLLGGHGPHTAEAAAQKLRAKYPRLVISGTYWPPFAQEFDDRETAKMLKAIREAQPDVLFVGLGSPKQEKWIARNLSRISVPVCIGVGAAIDVEAGVYPAIPVFLTAIGLEWLMKLIYEPRRYWRRYLFGIPRFLLLLLRTRVMGHHG
jgi:exopolysaccharide biosynthesis WecB/TagA/CpsF family protein